MSRVPPSLEYFVVYNKTLQATGKPSHDDDDAQEEAHILFYTCRPGGVKRDKMLRQIGLAKALISFSEAFTNGNGKACEIVHSAKTKLVMLSPEKDYWIHACVNVAYTERTNKDGSVKKEYQESSIHDIVLKTAVLKAYQEFKLLHGSFDHLLKKGRSSLERHLEKFFSVWAWKWEVEQPAEFISHLGTPLSAYCKYISPLIEEVQTMLPEDTPILILSSTNVLASSPSPSSPLWKTLPSHLIRHIPPYEPPPPPQPKGPSESTLRAKTKPKESLEAVLANNGAPMHSTVNFLSGLSSSKKWTGFLTFNGRSRPETPRSAQDAVTPPQTDLPSSTFKERSEAEVPQKVLATPSHPDVDQQSLEEAIASQHIPVPQETTQGGSPGAGKSPSPRKTHASVLSLEYFTNAAGGLFGAAKPVAKEEPANAESEHQADNKGPSQESSPPKPIVDIIDVTDNDEGEDTKTETSQKGAEEQTAAEQLLKDVLSHAEASENASDALLVPELPEPEAEPATEGQVEAASTPSQMSSRRSSVSGSQPAVLQPPPEAFFMPLGAYLEDEETSELLLRRVYHMSLGGVMLALVIRSPDTLQSPTDTSTMSSRRFASFGGVEVEEGLGYPAYTDLPRGLEYKAVDVLQNARRILDKWESERGKETASTNATTSLTTGTTSSAANGMRRFAVAQGEQGGSVLASLGFSSTAGWLFEGQSTLRRDSAILEQFSRTTTSQSWYISKRISASKRGGHEREIHMEVARKDSNLVDVDNDLATIVRRLDSTTY